MSVRTASQLLALIENQLGAIPGNPSNLPQFKVVSIMAGRINKEVKKDPKRYTWHNLELAVAYLKAKRIRVESPMAVFHFVDAALKIAAEPEKDRPIDQLIDDAISYEHEHHLPGWSEWIDRLVRAFGPARSVAYADWRKARHR